MIGVIEGLGHGRENLKSSDCQRCTAAAFVSTTALNWMLRYEQREASRSHARRALSQ